MKQLLYILALITPLITISHFAVGQCDINTGCAGAPIVSIDPPVFDAASLSIELSNISVGEISCTENIYQSGIAVYIYQLLPNGNRMELCNVINAAPFNVVGSVALSFGQTSFCSGSAINIGNVSLGPDEGFVACDGALLELEAVLFITDVVFDPSMESVYSALSPNEFTSVSLGTLNIDINGEFPGNGEPLTSANVTELATGGDGPITANCGEDVELYVEGLSRLANCPDYNDITTGIASELSNELYYTVNGGTPVIIQNASTGAAGGQLTGPDPNLGGNCYAGILGPYTLLWSDLPDDLCDGSTVVVTITTTDLFTGQTLSDNITINYTGAACAACTSPGCTDACADNFDPTATEDDGTCTAQLLGCMDVTACNYDPMALCDDPANPCDLGNAACADPCNPVMGCTDATACNFNMAACVDDGTCDLGNAACADPCNPVSGCTDAAACNFNMAACVDDGTCDLGNAACADPCNPVMGCTDAAACNFDAAACVDDGTCAAPPCNPGCTDPCADNFDANADADDGSCNPYDDTCNTDCSAGPFGGVWDAATCACINETNSISGCTDANACNFDAAANCDDGTCDLGNAACADPCNPVMGCTDATACNFDAAACIDDGTCTAPPCNPGCTDPCADNFDANADADDGSCNPYDDTCNTDCSAGPFDGVWDAATCACINETNPISGCTDSTASNFDPAANCNDGSCIAACTATAATIAGGPFQFCVGDGTPDFVSSITVSGGTGANTAWVVTDDQLNILGLPAMPGDVDFDGAGFGTCLIWYVTFDDITGAVVGMNAADLGGCFALSNSIEVIREDCSPCEEEITGVLIGTEEGCDLSSITISIIAPDGTNINVVTEVDGTFTVPGGPFPCGTYTAAFFDVNEIPLCYSETGSTEPISFIVDGNDGDVDVAFIANPNIPTLSQWGLMSLALLLMIFGAIKLAAINNVQLNRIKA